MSKKDNIKRKKEILLKPGWKRVQLGDVGTISSAGVDKKIRDHQKRVRLVNYLDVLNRDFIYANEQNHWVTASDMQIANCDVRKGDIFFTPSSEIQGDIAHSAVVMEDIKSGVYSYHIVRLRLKENWDLVFRAYAFKASNFIRQANRLCQGSGQRYVIGQDNFREMTVDVPPLPEQKIIGSILLTWDQAIQKIEELIATKEKLYKKEFKKFLDENEIQEIELKKIVDLYTGKRPKGGATQSGVFSLGAEHITDDGNFCFLKPKYVPNDFYEKMTKGRVEQDDILLAKDGATTGKCAFWDNSLELTKAAVNEHIFIFRVSSPEVMPFYLSQFLLSKKGQARIAEYKVEGVIGGINRSIENMKVQIPKLAAQKLNSDINRARKKELLTLTQIRDRYKSQRKSLMQKLLTGEWKVNAK